MAKRGVIEIRSKVTVNDHEYLVHYDFKEALMRLDPFINEKSPTRVGDFMYLLEFVGFQLRSDDRTRSAEQKRTTSRIARVQTGVKELAVH